MSSTTYATAQEAAQAMRAAMTQQKGKDGKEKTRLADQAPQWMRDAVRKIHDERDFIDPDDFKYQVILECLGVFADFEEAEWASEDPAGSLADRTGDDEAYLWFGSSFERMSYCDEVRGQCRDTLSNLRSAYYLEWSEISNLLQAALRAQVAAKPAAKTSAKRTTRKTKATATA